MATNSSTITTVQNEILSALVSVCSTVLEGGDRHTVAVKITGVIESLNHKRADLSAQELQSLQLLSNIAATSLEQSPHTTGTVLKLVPKETETHVTGSDNFVSQVAHKVNFCLRDAKEEFEQRLIDLALTKTKGNKSQAAKLMGITREGLRKAMLKRNAPVTTTVVADKTTQAA